MRTQFEFWEEYASCTQMLGFYLEAFSQLCDLVEDGRCFQDKFAIGLIGCFAEKVREQRTLVGLSLWLCETQCWMSLEAWRGDVASSVVKGCTWVFFQY